MNEKLFLYFSRKIGSLKVDGRKYAFCHPLNLELKENGELGVTCTAVDDVGDFYDLWWLPRPKFCADNLGKPVIKRIGKFKELPEKIINKIESYLDKSKGERDLNESKKYCQQ